METVEQMPPKLLKQQLKATWCAGNYAHIARTLEASTLRFLQYHPVRPGADVLDVACGAGQVALPAARAGARVCGVDIAENLIEQGRQRAREEQLAIRFDVGDAEALPYPDNRFDQIYSIIGAMFAPHPQQVVAELKRVCRPGGEIIMVNWTPEGFVGHFFKTVAAHVPPPAGMPSPLLWGDEEQIRQRFAHGIRELNLQKDQFEFHYPFPPEQIVAIYREYFGPVKQAFAALDSTQQPALRKDLEQLWHSYNQANDGTTHVQAEVLKVVAIAA